jgi:hypothetical protein
MDLLRSLSYPNPCPWKTQIWSFYRLQAQNITVKNQGGNGISNNKTGMINRKYVIWHDYLSIALNLKGNYTFSYFNNDCQSF